ncbi:MAG: ABC transporter ATP-binding protein [Planctomycetaceae bacterium]|nr:ABC transporter ATP-binding protein [Planctomycetaceae bacterium]
MMLEAVNLNKFFGPRQALDSVSFSIGKGETVAFLGAAGSGKSTLLRTLSGFLEPTHGAVRIGGMNPRLPRTRERIGYLPEGNPLPNHLRVREYLLYRAGLKGLHGQDGRAAVDRVIARCGLDDSWDRMILHLLRATKRRVGLADCLLAQPDVLLMDEPLLDLDAATTEEMRDLLCSLTDVTVAFSSHRLPEVERICDRVIVLQRGRVVANDSLDNLYDRYVEERVINLRLVSREPVRETLRAVTGVRTVTVEPEAAGEEGMVVHLTVPSGVDLRQELSQVCARRGWLVTEMRMDPVRLDDLFHRMT